MTSPRTSPHVYGSEVSKTTISTITDKVLDGMAEPAVGSGLFIDCMQKAVVAAIVALAGLVLLPVVALVLGTVVYGAGPLVSVVGDALSYGTGLLRLLVVGSTAVQLSWVAGLAMLLSVVTDAPLGAGRSYGDAYRAVQLVKGRRPVTSVRRFGGGVDVPSSGCRSWSLSTSAGRWRCCGRTGTASNRGWHSA